MSKTCTFLSIDLGASSGRGMIVTLADGKVAMDELHRFENFKVQLGETLHWNFLWLVQQITECLHICKRRGIALDAIGIDAWGVDFGLLDADGTLLGTPVCYRDTRTENIHAYSDPIMSQADIYAATACDPWPISTLMQLLAMKRDNSAQLDNAASLLHIPDLFNYIFTGIKANDLSNLTTGNMVDPEGQWATELAAAFDLPSKLFDGDIVAPPIVLGPLSEAIQKDTGLGPVPVVCIAGHDTASVVASVPAEGDDWAFLSCGTWSILGAVRDEAIADPACFAAGFTNEYTIDGWYLCHNISGLWLINELHRHWNRQGEEWSFARMTDEARAAASTGMVDVSDASLTAPDDMEQALYAVMARNNQPEPATRGELIRAVLESLAMEYARWLAALGGQTGTTYETLYMVGGGIANTLLCELTANACGLPVRAGVKECTALGNAMGQALAIGAVESLADVRRIMRDSNEMHTYLPAEGEYWASRQTEYLAMLGS
jgi:rhamnulokinase